MRACLWLSLLGIACGHTEPFVTADQEITGPYTGGVPLRLTYSPLSDYEPGISQDGAWLTYQFERGTGDADRCVSMLPIDGGQRQHELCAWGLGQAGFADGLANAALRTDGMLAFTMHSGLIGNMTSNAAGLYFGPSDSIEGAVRVLKLLEQTPGALTVWRDLIDPIWINNDELLVLAGERFLPNLTQVCGPDDCFGEFVPYDLARVAMRDTVALGVELVRLRIANGAATVVHTRAVPEAIAWSFDPSSGAAHLVRQFVRPFDDFIHESIADTVYTVNPAGGPATALYGTPRLSDGRYLERIHGIASGQGRIFLSRSWHHDSLATDQIIPPNATVFSDIAELLPDGSLQPVAPAVSWRWGRLRLAPDGSYLYAEAVERTSSDIYRIEIGP